MTDTKKKASTTISRSQLAKEKGTIPWLVGLLIFMGGMLLFDIYNDFISDKFQCDLYHLLEITFGLILIFVSLFISWIREHLKLNRWSHLEIIEDNGYMARFILGVEKRFQK